MESEEDPDMSTLTEPKDDSRNLRESEFIIFCWIIDFAARNFPRFPFIRIRWSLTFRDAWCALRESQNLVGKSSISKTRMMNDLLRVIFVKLSLFFETSLIPVDILDEYVEEKEKRRILHVCDFFEDSCFLKKLVSLV